MATQVTNTTGALSYFTNLDGDTDDHRIIGEFGSILTETGADRHTASGIAWQLAPTSATHTALLPLKFSIGKLACKASTAVTVKAWMKRTNTGITGKLVVKGGQLAGVPSDVTDTITAGADTWEQLSVNFTPTEQGVIEISAEVYGGTTYSVFVDDMEIS